MEPNGTRPPIADAEFDRLVDGSIPCPERRDLLSRLEAETDGWRRCALAFLQDQAWREALGPVASPDIDREPRKPDRARRTRFAPRLLPFSLAAGLVVAAFLLGRATGSEGRIQDSGRPPAPIVASGNGPAPPSPTATSSGSPGVAVAERGDEVGAVPIGPSSQPSEVQAIGLLSLATDADPDAPVVRLPVLAGPGLDDRWLRDQPSFVPEDVRQRWERHGYDVESKRRLVSVQVDDSGRYLTIPVDEVRLRGTPRITY